MSIFQRNVDALRALYAGGRFFDEVRLISGKLLADGSVTLAGAPTGKTWVRGSDNSREETAVWGYCGVANASVKCLPNSSGELEIVGVDYPEAVARLGGAVHAILAAPPLDDELAPRSIPGNGFKPGRLEPSQLGGLNVHVAKFWHRGGLWDPEEETPFSDDFDVSSYEPATAFTVCWVAVYLDPATNTLDAVADTPITGTQAELDEADLAAITLPDGVYPCGAFAFQEGQTSIDGSTRMVDMRHHHSLNTAGAGVQSVVAGTNVTVDNTDPANPIVSASGGGGGAGALILLSDRKTAATSGGTFTSGAWQTRDLNTENADTGANCTLSSNEFTLSAGTYRIQAKAPAFSVGRHRTRLYNVTDAAVQQDTGSNDIYGTSAYAMPADPTLSAQSTSDIDARFTLATIKALRVEHQCDSTLSTRGFGVESNFTGAEVYTVVRLEKE